MVTIECAFCHKELKDALDECNCKENKKYLKADKIKEISKEQFKKDIKGKKIKFHKDFNKGFRLWLCLNCGYPTMFMGLSVQLCECSNCKIKVYEMSELQDFLLKIQDIHFHSKKVSK